MQDNKKQNKQNRKWTYKTRKQWNRK